MYYYLISSCTKPINLCYFDCSSILCTVIPCYMQTRQVTVFLVTEVKSFTFVQYKAKVGYRLCHVDVQFLKLFYRTLIIKPLNSQVTLLQNCIVFIHTLMYVITSSVSTPVSSLLHVQAQQLPPQGRCPQNCQQKPKLWLVFWMKDWGHATVSWGINISPIPSKFIFSLKLQKFAFSEIVWKLLIECLYCIAILDNGQCWVAERLRLGFVVFKF